MPDSINLILFIKIKSLFKIIFYEICSFFFLIIRLVLLFLQPFILVRIGFVQSSRIGAIARFLDRLIHLQKIRKNNRDYYFIFYEKYISNNALKNLFEKESKKYKSKVFFFNESIFSKIIRFSYKKYKFGKSFFSYDTDNKNNKSFYFMSGKEINLKLSLKEEEKGQKYIDSLNIPKNKKWICIHNRDSYYLEKFGPNINEKAIDTEHFNYHSYRDFDVKDFLKAVSLFNDKGYHVFRIGNFQKNKMKYKNENFTDYPFSSKKSDFNDIYLLSNCSAYLGSDSGIADVPLIFGKPRYLINYSLSLIYLFHQDGSSSSYKNNDSFIFKHFYDRKEQRKLSLKEMFKYDLFKAGRTDTFKKAGVDLLENTPEEICDIANETLQNLNDQKENINDYEQQKKFWDIYYDNTNYKRYEDIPVKICSKFLLNNPYILE